MPVWRVTTRNSRASSALITLSEEYRPLFPIPTRYECVTCYKSQVCALLGVTLPTGAGAHATRIRGVIS